MPAILLKAWPYEIRKEDAWILPLWTCWCVLLNKPATAGIPIILVISSFCGVFILSVAFDACMAAQCSEVILSSLTGLKNRAVSRLPRCDRLSFLPFYFFIKPVRRVFTGSMICFRRAAAVVTAPVDTGPECNCRTALHSQQHIRFHLRRTRLLRVSE